MSQPKKCRLFTQLFGLRRRHGARWDSEAANDAGFRLGRRASVREIVFQTRAKNSSRRLNTVLVSGSEEDVVVRFRECGPGASFQLALFYPCVGPMLYVKKLFVLAPVWVVVLVLAAFSAHYTLANSADDVHIHRVPSLSQRSRN